MAKSAEGGFLNSITDLMTSLFVVFVLLLIAFINRSYAETREKSLTVRESLIKELNASGILATVDPKDPLMLLIIVREKDLQFDYNKSNLKPKGQEYLMKFIPSLSAVLTRPQFDREVQSIVIEGHTDSNGNDEHNLRLSQDRSFEVLRFALNGCHVSELQRNLFLDKVSVNGRGERDLLSNKNLDDEAWKAQCRRVEFKIRLRGFEQRSANKNSIEPKPLKSEKIENDT
ncbi:MAG: OmpA family protein [Candidatus Obscuribacterales bacterium]|jgi:outer membrane protein OmpA-like peptidoglycan-associated protein|nr:OmpA family protein [Candidatus Obscuribacterales bacterium]